MKWIVTSVITAVIFAGYFGLCLLLFQQYYFALSIIGVFLVVLVVMLLRDPAYRYMRFAGWVFSSWVMALAVPNIKVNIVQKEITSSQLEVDSSLGWTVNGMLGMIVIACLILDYMASPDHSAIRFVIGRIHLRFGGQNQQVSGGTAYQIGDVSGQSTIYFNQPDINSELDVVNQFLEDGNPKAAISYLERIDKNHGAELNQQQAFLLAKYYGRAYNLMGEISRSSVYYQKAGKFRPTDQEGRECNLMSNWLDGLTGDAYRQAKDLSKDFPGSALAAAVTIHTAPDDIEVEALVERINGAVKDDVKVLEALAYRSLREDKASKAEKYARDALSEKSSNPIFKGLLGETIIAVEARSAMRLIINNIPLPEITNRRLAEAISLLSDAVRSSCSPLVQSTLRNARGLAYELMKKISEAESDLVEARKLVPTDSQMHLKYAQFLGRQSRLTEALETLRPIALSCNDFDLILTFAHLAEDIGDNDDKHVAKDLLKALVGNLGDQSDENVFEILMLLVKLHVGLGCADSLLNFRSEMSAQGVAQYIIDVADAEIQINAGCLAEANSAADRAIERISDSTGIFARIQMSSVLNKLGRHKDRLNVLREVADAGNFELVGRDALNAAISCNDDGFVIDYTRSIREFGIWDPYAVQLEVEYLRRYREYHLAIEICQKFISICHDRRLCRSMRLRLSQLAIFSGCREYLVTDPELLPVIDEIAPSDGLVLCALLEESPNPLQAVAFAYELVRRNFQSHFAHLALCHAVGFGRRNPIEIQNPRVIEAMSAVRFRINGSPASRWVILEDSENPNATINEYSLNHPLCRELLGKNVGDQFEDCSNPLIIRTGVIEEIKHKYKYRVGDTIARWNDLFPEIPFVYPLDIQIGENDHLDFSPVVRILEREAMNEEEHRNVYRSNPNLMSILTFASWRKSNAIDTIKYLSQYPDLPIRCCSGSAEEFEIGRSAMNSQSIVADPTALSLLFISDLWMKIKMLPFRLIVTQSSIEEFEHLVVLQEYHSDNYMVPVEGQLVLVSRSSDQQIQRAERIRAFCNWLRENAEIRSGLALSKLPSEFRDILRSMYGDSASESYACAIQDSLPIWTDDFTVSIVIGESHSVKRTWTQLVGERLRQEKSISDDAFSQLLVMLISYGYTHTQCTSGAVVFASKQSNWDPKARPLIDVLSWIGNNDIQAPGVLVVVLGGLKILWRSPASVYQRDSVTIAIARSILSRSDGRKLLDMMIKLLDQLFLVQPDVAEQCRKIFIYATENPVDRVSKPLNEL